MAASLRKWILILALFIFLLFMFNRWVVSHMLDDKWRSKILRFQLTCVIQVFVIFMAFFNWANLSTLFDTFSDKSRLADHDKDKKDFKFRFQIQWREIGKWKKYSVKSAIWRGFLVTVLILSQFVYTSFSFLISANPFVITYVLFLCLAFSVQLFFALVVCYVIRTLHRLVTNNSVRAWRTSKYPRVAVVLYAVFVVMVGFSNTFKLPEIKEVDIPIKGLPSHLDKMTITFVSDIHLGPTVGQRSFEPVVHMINYLQSDIVVIGGDLVDGTVSQLGTAADPIEWIKSKYGVYFVTGNHEYYTADTENWFRKLESLGVKVLHNSNVILKGKGETGICLAGVDDPTADSYRYMDHTMDIDGALRSCDKESPVILVAHQPMAAKAALQSRYRLDLVLSGHTHGGQMFPLIIGAYLLNPFYAGLYKYGEDSHVYVSMGTMYWGIPVRFGTHKEITKITLKTKV